MNEAETRAEHIDPALKAAGWGVVEGSRVRREYRITEGRIEGHGRRGKADIADYVLEYRNHKLAIVEAKAFDERMKSEAFSQVSKSIFTRNPLLEFSRRTAGRTDKLEIIADSMPAIRTGLLKCRSMNILIEDAETLEYLASNNLWTKNAATGKDFGATGAAFTIAKKELIGKFNIVGYNADTKQFINLHHGKGKGAEVAAI